MTSKPESGAIPSVIIDGIILRDLNHNSNNKPDGKETSNGKQTYQYKVKQNNCDEPSECCSKFFGSHSKKGNFCNNVILKRFTIIQWLDGYNVDWLIRDCIAGLTVGLTAIPQGIAYAVVAGLPPQYGLYSSILTSLIYTIFGTCKDIIIGPTAIMALMTQPIVMSYGADYAILLAFLSGIISVILGLFHSGLLVEFISLPVTAGFTSAAAVTIASSQLKSFFGLNGKSSDFVGSINSIANNLNKIRWTDTLLGVTTLFVLLIGRYAKTKAATWSPNTTKQKIIAKTVWILGLSSNAVVVIFGTLLAYTLAKYEHNPFILTGNVTGGLPVFKPPPFSVNYGNQTTTFLEMLTNMGSAVITIPLIAILELTAIVKSFEKGKVVDASQEMITLGLCNIAGSFISSMPVSGSFTRTAINHASGVVTPLGGVFTVFCILLALEFLASLFYYIPKATLAALIIMAMVFMIEYDIVVKIWRTKKSDLVPFFVSFLVCLFFGIEVGMTAGICTNLLLLLYKSARPVVNLQWFNVNNEEFLIVTPTQNLSFPASEYIRDLIINTCAQRNSSKPVIILGTHVYNIDSSVAKGILLLAEDLKTRNQKLYLWKWRDNAIKTCVGYDPSIHQYFYFDDTVLALLNGVTDIDNENYTTDIFCFPTDHRN